jgi:hypothetical protein
MHTEPDSRAKRPRTAILIALALLAIVGAAGAIYLVGSSWFGGEPEQRAERGPPPQIEAQPEAGEPPSLTEQPPSVAEEPSLAGRPPLAEEQRPQVDEPPQVAERPPPSPPAATERVRAEVDRVLAGFTCAGLSADLTRTTSDTFQVTVSGYVMSEADRQLIGDRLASLDHVGQVANDAEVLPPPFCEVLGVLQTGTVLDTADAPRIELEGGAQVYHENDPLIVRATAAHSFDGFLYVDYFDGEGNVVHLLPTPARPDNWIAAGQQTVLGMRREEAGPGDRYYEIMPLFGLNMLVAMSSPRLLFDRLREEVEPGETYLTELQARLATLPASEEAARPVAAHCFITTAPREQSGTTK